MRPTKTQICKRNRAVWSESSLSTWRVFASLAIQNVPSKDSDQTARMRRLIWIFAGRTCPKLRLWTFLFIYSVLLEHKNVHFCNTTCKNMSFGICGQQRPRSACASAQSDQDLRCPLAESLDAIELINGERMPGWDFAHAWDESEYVHFAHARRHLFAWRGPYNW